MQEFNRKRLGAVRNGATLGGVAVAALAGGYILRGSNVVAQPGANTTDAPVISTAATRDASAIQSAFTQVSDVVEPAVVTITTERATPRTSTRRGVPGMPGRPNTPSNPNGNDPFDDFFKQFEKRFGIEPNSYQRDEVKQQFFKIQSERGGGGLGSGMIFRNDGYIITNAHVVKGADKDGITVKLADNREFRKAQLVGIDEGTDVAVLKINAINLPTVKLGDSEKVNVGDWAIAVGNPFGLEHTVTVGIISAKSREVALAQRGGNYLQTDASINPGNSGGPLCDINGRVVGVNNAIYSESGGNMGIGFAIPINTARDIAQRLVRDGKITRGYLGVMIATLESKDALKYGLPADTKGVLVSQITANTPGAKAGLQEGDIIVAFNGKAVEKSNDLQQRVGAAPVGSSAQLKVLRDGRTVTLNAKLEELKPEGSVTTPTPEDATPAPTASAFGLTLKPITPALAKQFSLSNTAKGVLVTAVAVDSPAAQSGIQRGDLIERVGQKSIASVADFTQTVQSILGRYGADDQKQVALLINRKGDKTYISVTSN